MWSWFTERSVLTLVKLNIRSDGSIHSSIVYTQVSIQILCFARSTERTKKQEQLSSKKRTNKKTKPSLVGTSSLSSQI